MAENGKAKRAPAKKKAYKMPDKVPKGELLKDKNKNTWVIGDSIGIGGFGEIYSAIKQDEKGSAEYVVKIEPKENGPLFCERTVYVNISKKELIDEFSQSKKLKRLGMPGFYGFGSHLLRSTEYRFIVIEKLGKDLWKLFLEGKRSLPLPTTLKIGVQILFVLEYIHSQGYCHNDVKGANLLLGVKKGTENQVYLVDFGLASKFSIEYKPNPKKAHNGTLEYTSRDSHLGVQTRRGDLEILVYNLLQWDASKLPWEHLTSPPAVQTEKEKLMKDTKQLLKLCYKTKKPSDGIKNLLEYLATLDPVEAPNYEKSREFLLKELKDLRSDVNKLEFVGESKKPISRAGKSPAKRSKSSARSPKIVSESPAVSKAKKMKMARSDTDLTKVGVKKVQSPRGKLVNGTKDSPLEKKRTWRDFPTIVNGAGAKQ